MEETLKTIIGLENDLDKYRQSNINLLGLLETRDNRIKELEGLLADAAAREEKKDIHIIKCEDALRKLEPLVIQYESNMESEHPTLSKYAQEIAYSFRAAVPKGYFSEPDSNEEDGEEGNTDATGEKSGPSNL